MAFWSQQFCVQILFKFFHIALQIIKSISIAEKKTIAVISCSIVRNDHHPMVNHKLASSGIMLKSCYI